jgi:two-component system sensor histidine kinase DesK
MTRFPLPGWPGRHQGLGAVLVRVFTLLWLLFLIFPTVGLLDSDAGAAFKGAVLGMAAVFVAIYVYTMAGPRPAVWPDALGVSWWSLAAMAALATATCLADGNSWLGMYIYVSAAAATRRTGAAQGVLGTLLLALLVATRVGTSAFGSGGIGTAVITAEILSVGGMLLGYSRLVRMNRQLVRGRDAAARLAVSEERLRIARDLHDLLGHQLALISLKSQLVARLAPADGEQAAAEALEIEHLARRALQDVRDAVAAYYQPRLETELAGLRLALEAAGVQVTVVDETVELAEECQTVFAWAVREAATNVVRHTRASRVAVRMAGGGDRPAVLEVVDNGPAATGAADGPETGGRGILGLRERVRSVGGELEAGPAPNGGFRLSVTVPARGAAAPSPAIASSSRSGQGL